LQLVAQLGPEMKHYLWLELRHDQLLN
jgi:hypothetical protein